MAEEEKGTPLDPSPPLKSISQSDAPPTPPSPSPSSASQSRFDPSRMIGIIKRKALIKELAAAYHTDCLALARELLELQKKKEEPFLYTKAPEDQRKETLRSSKRAKKLR